jgi:hypothetical protein
MTPDATPERDTANQEARLAAHPRLFAPRCAVCGLCVSLDTYRCAAHPDSRVLLLTAYEHITRTATPEPSYLTWSNALVVLLGFALAWALTLLVLS